MKQQTLILDPMTPLEAGVFWTGVAMVAFIVFMMVAAAVVRRKDRKALQREQAELQARQERANRPYDWAQDGL